MEFENGVIVKIYKLLSQFCQAQPQLAIWLGFLIMLPLTKQNSF